ncbi:MAG: hypothetical protein PHT12_04135 [Patescibacteria group bacterium]|nr:hypothetical protein [Patescibacteria group bacterium]
MALWCAGCAPLGPEIPQSDILVALRQLPLREQDGYFWLDDNGKHAETLQTTNYKLPTSLRHRRFRLGETHFERARTFARWTRHLSSVRLIAVCNSLALVGADEDSDIDLFVVCRPGTLWITRLVVVGALHVLGLRPTPQHQAGRLCLSFFLSEENLDLSRFAFAPDDIYLTYWLATLVTVYDAGGVEEKIFAANPWLKEQLPGFRLPVWGHRRKVVRPRVSVPLAVLRWLEPWAERFETRRLPKAITELQNRDTRVVVSKDALKFHVNDRREEYRDRFLEWMRALKDNKYI